MCNRSENNKLLRFSKHCKDYKVPNFSVFRKDIFEKIINHVPNYESRDLCPDRGIVDELIQSFYSVIYTKIYLHSAFYLVRQLTSVRKNNRDEIDNNWDIDKQDKKEFLKAKLFLEESIIKTLKEDSDISDINNFVNTSINNYFLYRSKSKSKKSKFQILTTKVLNKLKSPILKLYFLRDNRNLEYKKIENIILNFKKEY